MPTGRAGGSRFRRVAKTASTFALCTASCFSASHNSPCIGQHLSIGTRLGGEGSGFSRFPPLAVGQGESQQPTDPSPLPNVTMLTSRIMERWENRGRQNKPAFSYQCIGVSMAAVLRAFFGYFFLVFIVRIVGRRPGKQMTPFEFVLIFFIGGLALTAIVGDEVSFTNGICQIITIGSRSLHARLGAFKVASHGAFGGWNTPDPSGAQSLADNTLAICASRRRRDGLRARLGIEDAGRGGSCGVRAQRRN